MCRRRIAFAVTAIADADMAMAANRGVTWPSTASGTNTASAHNLTCLRRNALAITLTDEKAMAAAAMIGDNRMPRKG